MFISLFDTSSFITHAIHVLYCTDLSGIQYLLKRNNSGDPINSLCTTTPEGKYEIKGFSAAEAVYPYVEKFFIMSSKHPNTLFDSFWLETLSQVGSNNEVITFQQVVNLVWTPVWEQCIQLLKDLQTYRMLLTDVDKVITKYSDQEDLINDIALLYQAVNECSSKGIEDFQWIRGVCNCIWHYRNLCNYHDTAKSLLEICNSLGLTGDISLIESIANKVSS